MTNGIATLGIDLGKNWFHLTGLDKHNKSVYRTRVNRKKLTEFIVTLPQCVVAMESCPGSQYWGRRVAEAGHQLMIIPAQFVKPFLKTNKNDFNDSLAIAEAAGRPDIRCVPLKNAEQLELQAVHRVRNRLITERTAIVNQMRALLLEHGIVIPPGRKLFARELPRILEDAENGLTIRLRALIDRLRNRWRLLDTEIDELTDLLKDYALESSLCRRASSVPGVGPIVSTAIVAAVGDAQAFQRGRDMAAWLGLVPKQSTTGNKPKLGGISKRGNQQLRALLIQGANALFIHMKRDQSAIGEWLRALEARSHRHVAIVALANKIIRICWKVLTSGENYRPYPASV